jgi:uncharacterized membrane protein
MAGIGFEIRKILKKETLLSVLEAYGYAALIGSGPWVLSVIGVMVIGVLSFGLVVPETLIIQFLVSVTYLMASSLILTGVLQLMFTRFIADRLFENKRKIIFANSMGALWLTLVVSGGLGVVVLMLFFNESLWYELLMLANFVVLCGLWIVVIFLSSMKAYRAIVSLFFVGYAIAVVASLSLTGFGLPGLLAGVLLGHGFLFFSFLFLIVREYPGDRFIGFDFLKRHQIFISLSLTGLFFNAAVWVDKFIFWFTPETSQSVIGPLRASIIYDLPIFLAYLSIIPGMAVFLVRMEADFAEHYDRFYKSVREGDTLQHIWYLKDRMIYTARQGIYEIFKIQGVTVMVVMLLAEDILKLIGISTLYLRLFYIDLIGVSVQVLLLAILNVMFYLDYRRLALGVCGLFLFANALLTYISIHLGAAFYGYGFTVSVTITVIVGLFFLSRKLDRLEYETFMLQGS